MFVWLIFSASRPTLRRNLIGADQRPGRIRRPAGGSAVRYREIVVDRTTAPGRCEYEWGVHLALFASKADLTPARFTSLAHGTAIDSCRTEHRPAVADDAASRP